MKKDLARKRKMIADPRDREDLQDTLQIIYLVCPFHIYKSCQTSSTGGLCRNRDWAVVGADAFKLCLEIVASQLAAI